MSSSELSTEIGHRRIRSPGEADVGEAVFLDEVQSGFRVALSRTEVQQPVVAVGDLPALPDLHDSDRVAIEGDRVFARCGTRWRLSLRGQPIHQGLLAGAGWSAHETNVREAVVLDDGGCALG